MVVRHHFHFFHHIDFLCRHDVLRKDHSNFSSKMNACDFPYAVFRHPDVTDSKHYENFHLAFYFVVLFFDALRVPNQEIPGEIALPKNTIIRKCLIYQLCLISRDISKLYLCHAADGVVIRLCQGLRNTRSRKSDT